MRSRAIASWSASRPSPTWSDLHLAFTVKGLAASFVMSLMMNAQTIALDRFGLGARPDEALPADPKAWLHAQLGGFDPRPAAIAAAPTRQEVATQLADYLEQVKAMGGKAAARKAPASVLVRSQPASMTAMSAPAS